MSKTRHQNDPLAIMDRLEMYSDTDSALYRKRVETLMAAALTRYGDIDDSSDAKTLRRTNAGHALETAALMAGFVIGFEHRRSRALFRIR